MDRRININGHSIYYFSQCEPRADAGGSRSAAQELVCFAARAAAKALTGWMPVGMVMQTARGAEGDPAPIRRAKRRRLRLSPEVHCSIVRRSPRITCLHTKTSRPMVCTPILFRSFSETSFETWRRLSKWGNLPMKSLMSYNNKFIYTSVK